MSSELMFHLHQAKEKQELGRQQLLAGGRPASHPGTRMQSGHKKKRVSYGRRRGRTLRRIKTPHDEKNKPAGSRVTHPTSTVERLPNQSTPADGDTHWELKERVRETEECVERK